MEIKRKSAFDFPSDNEARADELRHIGFDRLANMIADCKPGWFCRQRLCPTCGPFYAAINAGKVRVKVLEMRWPHTYMLTLRSKHLWDLKATVEEFRACLRKLRVRKYWKQHVRSGAGAIEVKLSNDRRAWVVHSHFVLDVLDPTFDVELIDEYWRKYTNGRGSFMRQTGNRVVMENLTALASYNAKADTWCPPPGALYPDELRHLIRAIKGKQLPILFPSRRKRKPHSSEK